jgi:putative AdoMet-dependent methyltransferase
MGIAILLAQRPSGLSSSSSASDLGGLPELARPGTRSFSLARPGAIEVQDALCERGDRAMVWDFDRYDWVDRYDESMANMAALCYGAVLERMAHLAAPRAGELALDIGTGTGNSATALLERGCLVVGLDPSERMLRHANEKAARWPGLYRTARVADPFLAIPYPDATFALVVSAYAIHHLTEEDKLAAVREMRRVLAPGGRVIVGDVMFRDHAERAAALTGGTDLDDDEHYPLLSSFPAMFEACGLRTEAAQVGPWAWVLAART